MKPSATLRRAIEVDALGTVVAVGCIVGGCLSLIFLRWTLALVLLGGAGVFGMGTVEELNPEKPRIAWWRVAVELVAAVAFVGAGVLEAVDGNFVYAGICGFSAAVIVIGFLVAWLRMRARRSRAWREPSADGSDRVL